MEIVEIWQNLDKNSTQIMIFLRHYMWAENNEKITRQHGVIHFFTKRPHLICLFGGSQKFKNKFSEKSYVSISTETESNSFLPIFFSTVTKYRATMNTSTTPTKPATSINNIRWSIVSKMYLFVISHFGTISEASADVVELINRTSMVSSAVLLKRLQNSNLFLLPTAKIKVKK